MVVWLRNLEDLIYTIYFNRERRTAIQTLQDRENLYRCFSLPVVCAVLGSTDRAALSPRMNFFERVFFLSTVAAAAATTCSSYNL